MAVFAPRMSVTTSEISYALPSSFEFRTMFDKAQDNKWTVSYKARQQFMKVFTEVQNELKKEHNVESLDSLAIDPFGLAIEKTEEEGQVAYDQTYGQLIEIFKKQNHIHHLSAFLSPLIGCRAITMALSGTDFPEHDRFSYAAEKHRREVMKTLNLDIAYNSKLRKKGYRSGSESGTYKQDKEFWTKIPDFKYNTTPIKQLLKGYTSQLFGLAVWILGSCVFSLIAIRRIGLR